MHSEIQRARFFVWFFIVFALILGAGAYWFFSGKYQGQAAEKLNSSQTTTMTNTLVGYWTLDGNNIVWGDTTSEIKDVNPGTKHNGNSSNLAAGSAVPGRVGQGLLFNGSSDTISLGSVYNGVKTVAFWVKPNTTTQSLIDLNATATVDINAGTVRGNNFTTPTIYVDGAATSTFPDTAWHHVAVTTATGINASAAYIGQIASSYFGGTIDDIRIYSDALTATQVADLYRASGAKEISNANHREALTNGLVGYWTFDGRDIDWGDASEIKDISGNGNHGDVAGSLATTSVVPGKLGQGLSFNGTSDYINVGSASSLDDIDLQGGGGMTVSVWIYPRGLGENSEGHIVAKSSGVEGPGGGEWGFFLRGTNQLAFGKSYNTQMLTVYSSNNVWVTNSWQHVVVIWDGNATTSTAVKFYVNGSETGHTLDQNGTGTKISDSTVSLFLGNNIWENRTFNGNIDDIRIYNRVLTVAEIGNLYIIGR